MRAAIVMTTRLKLAQKTFETQHIYKSDEEARACFPSAEPLFKKQQHLSQEPMNIRCSNRIPSLRLVSAAAFLFFSIPSPRAELATGRQGMAATVHPLATEAALAAMRKGGNAVDAAVAAALTLGVVDGHNSGIGGGCLMLLRLANGSILALDGRETAPAAATRDMFIRAGQADPRLSQTGALAVGVPGSLAVYDYVLKRHGKFSLKTHLEAAARTAENGFALSPSYAECLAATAAELKQFPAARAIFLRSDGQPWVAGDLLKQPNLARSYRAIAQEGIAWFYGGTFARSVDEWMRLNGGILRAADFQAYRMKLREPLRTTYHQCEIVGFPPPSSGGVHVAQILNILEPFNVRTMPPSSAEFIHVTAEAMKLAFADRAFWLGDSDFSPVPRGLFSKEYARTLAGQIRLDRVTQVHQHGTPADAPQNIIGKHTTHFSTADAAGNWVACTATINTSFGSKVVVPGTGILLNNQMDDFSIQPGTANFYGLVGADANAIAPGKRPLSSMSPTIVLKEGRPILAVGAAGGPTIISQTLLAILNTIDFGMPLDQALAQPRFHHQWKPDELVIESRANPEAIREIEKRGHKVRLVEALGATQAVGVDGKKDELVGVHDPRVDGR